MKFLMTAGFVLAALQLFAGLNLEGRFDWNSKEVKVLNPAIRYVRFSRLIPRLIRMTAVRVDLTDPRIDFKMTPRAKDWGKPMPAHPKYIIRTERKTCRRFMEETVKNGENMVLVVNGSPWVPWRKDRDYSFADRLGLIVDNGILVSPPRGKNSSFVVGKDGSYRFEVFGKKADLSGIRHAITGFLLILRDGKLEKPEKNNIAPRTGFGLSADGKTLYILVADGRQIFYSMGITTVESAEMLRYLGASDAVNMDGGGSTTLFVRDESGTMHKLNHYIFGKERAVGGAMGIIYR